MFQPRVPVNPTPTGEVIPVYTPTPIEPHAGHAPTACHCQSPAPVRPSVQLTPGAVVAVAGAGTAVALVVGAVLVSMLLAVALTGASLAICALVIRSLVTTDAKRR
ncbi:SpdD-like protein [Streptomyces sp. NPDC050704]|uniref:SpdD-like protein n=1 Tax=Streptomyces sp. NPDC050704 TaxID=3157219 RepID=UPI003427ACAF